MSGRTLLIFELTDKIFIGNLCRLFVNIQNLNTYFEKIVRKEKKKFFLISSIYFH